MIGLVISTHGALGEALLQTAGMIVGAPLQACAVSLSRSTSPEELCAVMANAVASVDDGEGVLVMADMFGGTPANIGMTLLNPGKMELLTGVNLPMVLKFLTYRERLPLPVLAANLQTQAREGIVLASEILRRQD